jgi:hypothetical protein
MTFEAQTVHRGNGEHRFDDGAEDWSAAWDSNPDSAQDFNQFLS